MPALSSTLSPTLSILDDDMELDGFTRKVQCSDGQMLALSSLRIGGIHCAACATTIEQALRRVDGVLDVNVSAAARCAAVKWDTRLTKPSALVQAIERAGYTAVPDTAAAARAARQSESRDALWRLFVAVFCSMQVMMLATPSYLGGVEPDLKHLLDWGGWVFTLPVMAFSAAPFLSGAWRSLRHGRVGMDVPAALGMVVAFAASSGAAFDPAGMFGQEVYFDSLTMFASFLLAGRYLEMKVRHRAEVSLEDSIGRLPDTAWLQSPDGQVSAVSVLRLKRGDLVRIPVGQAFCADGVLVEGATRADEALLTGECRAVPKAIGDAVVAGSINLGAPVLMRVECVGADTRYEAIVAMMRDARSQRPASSAAADRWAAPFTWAVLLGAAGAAAVWSQIDPHRAVWVAVAVLIVTCPCALSLAVPSAMLASATAMARKGVLLRKLDAVEKLARMQTVFLDKTGTLTQAHGETVRLTRIDQSPRWRDADLLGIAAALASWSSHPLAQVLAQGQGASLARWRELQETAGQGMQGRAEDGAIWQLGKMGSGHEAACGAVPQSDGAQSWLSCDGKLVAALGFAEGLREHALQAVQALREDGVKVVLLSGDAPERVAHLAGSLGLAEHHGGMTPQDKLAMVRSAQARGEVVGMVGDGINDAPVLAQADISLAMGEGAQIARAQADGVLLANSLSDVVAARVLARRTLGVVRQNVAWAVSYNLICVPLAIMGWLPPWAAGLGMATSSLVVILNSLRLMR